MLITAKHAEPRSEKSVRESKAALKQYFFSCLAENMHEILLQLSRVLPSFLYSLFSFSTPLRLPRSLSSFQAQMRHCRACSSPSCLPLGSSDPLFWGLVTATAAVGRAQTRCPLWMPFCSPWHCFCLLPYQTNTFAFHSSAWEAVEQAWSAQEY